MILDTDLGATSLMDPSCPRYCERLQCSFDSFSHFSRQGTKWTHEVGSEMMFDSLVKENEIPISEKDQIFIKALIAGEHSRV